MPLDPQTAATRQQGAAAIGELIAQRWPQRFEPGQICDEISLGADGGLGLDSIEIVEVITECEERFGREASAELFESAPLTLSRVADFFLR